MLPPSPLGLSLPASEPVSGVLEHLEDLEDVYLATQRLERPGKTYSAEEVKHELGL